MKKISLTLKPFYPLVMVYSNSHQVLLYLQRLCSLLQIKAFIVKFGGGRRGGTKKKVVLAMQLATVDQKKHLYIFFLVQLLKCKTFPVIPWEVSFLCFMFFFFIFSLFHIFCISHLTELRIFKISKARGFVFIVLSILFSFSFFFFQLFASPHWHGLPRCLFTRT